MQLLTIRAAGFTETTTNAWPADDHLLARQMLMGWSNNACTACEADARRLVSYLRRK